MRKKYRRPAAKGTRRFFIMERVSGGEKRNSNPESILRLMLEPVDRVKPVDFTTRCKDRNALVCNREGNNVTEY